MTITLGTQFEANAQGDSVRVVNLTSTTAIVVYSEVAANEINCRLATLAAGIWSVGAEENIAADFSTLVKAVRLTDTSALLCWSDGSGGSASEAMVLTVTGTTVTANFATSLTQMDMFDLVVINSTKCLLSYVTEFAEGQATVLTVSGTTVTQQAFFEWDVGEPSNIALVGLSSTKFITTWLEDLNSQFLEGQVLNVSGNTVTGNTTYTLVSFSGDIQFGDTALRTTSIDKLTETTAIFVWRRAAANNGMIAYIITEAATVLSAGSVISLIVGGDPSEVSVRATSSSTGMAAAVINSTIELVEFSIVAGVITVEDNDTTLSSSGTSCDLALLSAPTLISGWDDSAEIISVVTSLVSADLSVAPMTKPASISASGDFIYVALLEGGTPILSKFNVDLGSDGTTIFNPGAGDNIGVQCARFDNDLVYVAGNFDGTNVVEKSDDAGSSFTVVDDGAIGDVKTFIVGPDSDDRILVFDETNGDILETVNAGDLWSGINTSVSPEVLAIGRLGVNVQESVFGNESSASDNVDYSINSGANLEDFNLPVEEDVTGIIVN